MHCSAVRSARAKLRSNTWHVELQAHSAKPKSLLFEGPDKVMGFWGAAVPKEPLGSGLENLELGPEAGLNSQAI